MDIVDVEKNLSFELYKDFRGMKDGFVQVGERKWFYPKKYRELAEEYKNFEVRSDDIWIMGYPRSGTTLTENLVWLLSHNLNFDEAKAVGLSERVRFFELNMVLNEKTAQEVVELYPDEEEEYTKWRNTLKILNKMKTRRIMKTHLPFELLPPDVLNKGCKIVYICRYPKDVCASFYNLQKDNRATQYSGDFEKYYRYFKNGHTMFGPYFEHVKQGFDQIDTKNFMFTFYEDFNKDNRSHIKKLSEFLDVSITERDLDNLEDYIRIDNFRKLTEVKVKNTLNEPVEFIRKGRVGGWREHFTEEMDNDADDWIATNTRSIGIKYPQEK